VSEKRVRARATVTIQLRIEGDDVWGSDCQISQVYKQASEGALIALNNELRPILNRCTIIGEPKVDCIVVECAP
jgi:hypothetical protein